MYMKNKYLCSILATFLAALNVTGQSGKLKNSRPNIILVLTDDQGMGDLSCMGNPILETPNLDSFYKQSIRFADFHVSPTCAPTRSAIMSGRRPFEVGVSHTVMLRERMALDVITFPQVLQTAGYETAIFGKWHLGDEEAYLPQNRGFDEVLIHGAGGLGQYRWGDFELNEQHKYFDNVLLHNDIIVKTKGFCTDLFFEAALAWIQKQHEMESPYFAYISLNAPHGPMIAPENYKERFLEAGYDEKTAGRYGMIENIDHNFGKMMAKLTEWDALENTLIIFMTDNGMSMSSIQKDGKKIKPFNAGLRGGKNSTWEGGTHVPSFWYWKDKLEGGIDIPALTAHLDLYPTFCDLAGKKVPDGPLKSIGRSLVPLLEDSKHEWLDRRLFFHRGRWDDGIWNKKDREANKFNSAGVRSKRWRLVFQLSEGNVVKTLSDISVDRGEQVNLAEQHPEVVARLSADFDKWWDSTQELLVNEGLPMVQPSEQPLTLRYKEQLLKMGIPEWDPNN